MITIKGAGNVQETMRTDGSEEFELLITPKREKELEEEITLLEKKVEMLEKSNDFYADVDNWELVSNGYGQNGMLRRMAVIKDCDLGEKAREIKKEIGMMSEN